MYELFFSCILYLLTYLLHGAEFSLISKGFAAGQEILRILWNPKVRYRVYKCPPSVPNQSQLNPVHTSHFLKIHLNIIHPSTPGSPQRSPSLRLLHQNVAHNPPLSTRATCSAHHILLDFITRKILCPLRLIKMTDVYFDNLCSFGVLCLRCWSDRYSDATVIRGIL